jgi:hypothetical protein
MESEVAVKGDKSKKRSERGDASPGRETEALAGPILGS